MGLLRMGLLRMGLLRMGLLLGALGLLTACGTTQAAGPGAVVPSSFDSTRHSSAVPRPDASSSLSVPYDGRPSPFPPCSKAGTAMRAWPAEEAMGLRVLTIELENCGTRPYTLNGYPEVRVLDEDREPLPVKVVHGAAPITVLDSFDAGPRRVTLKPGESAKFGLVWRNTVTLSTEPAVNSTYAGITPATGEDPQTLPVYLDLGTTGILGISAWSRSEVQDRPSGMDRPGAPSATEGWGAPSVAVPPDGSTAKARPGKPASKARH